MNSRERVFTALAHKEADRVPFSLWLGWDYQALRTDVPDFAESYAGGNPRNKQVQAPLFEEYTNQDIRWVWWREPPKPEQVPAAEWTPRPTPSDIGALAAAAAALRARGLVVCGVYSTGVFETAKHWLGVAPTLTAPYDDPRGFEKTLDLLTDWKCAIYGAYAAAGTDLVYIGDDLGTQRALVMSPAQYREWYRPRHRRIVEHIRAIRHDAKIAFHCCGHVTPLIRDLIGLGIDILQVVQPEAMDIAQLKREFGRDLSFWGGVGAQSAFGGTPQAVVEAVRKTLSVMAPGGGYIVSPSHRLTPEVPWENVLAFYEGVQRYGGYAHK